MDIDSTPTPNPPVGDDLDLPLRSVLARSARRRRARQGWITAGAAVVILVGGSVAVGASSAGRRDQLLDVTASPGSTDPAAALPVGSAPPTGGAVPPGTITTIPPTSGPSTSFRPTTSGRPTTTVSIALPTSTLPPSTSTSSMPTTNPQEPGFDMTLEEARQLWATKRPDVYRVTVKQSCFCADVSPRTILVKGNTISWPAGGSGFTVDDLYAKAANLGPEGRITNLRVDRMYGFPRALTLDHNITASDDEMSYTIELFETL